MQNSVIYAKDVPEVFTKYQNVLNKLKNKLKKILIQKGLEEKKHTMILEDENDTLEDRIYKYKIAIKIVKQEIKEAKKAAPKVDSDAMKQARKKEKALAKKAPREKASISSRLLKSRNGGSKRLGIKRPHPKKEE